jgi:hypothetical protein
MMATSRPGENDRALPMAYGDLILLSCNVTNVGTAYLSEDGCVVVKDSDVDMRTSSRELVFEVRGLRRPRSCSMTAMLHRHVSKNLILTLHAASKGSTRKLREKKNRNM